MGHLPLVFTFPHSLWWCSWVRGDHSAREEGSSCDKQLFLFLEALSFLSWELCWLEFTPFQILFHVGDVFLSSLDVSGGTRVLDRVGRACEIWGKPDAFQGGTFPAYFCLFRILFRPYVSILTLLFLSHHLCVFSCCRTALTFRMSDSGSISQKRLSAFAPYLCLG